MSSPSRRASGVRRRRSAWAASVAVLAVVIPAGAVAADEADVRHEVDGTVVYVISDPPAADGSGVFDEGSVTQAFVDVDGTLVDVSAVQAPVVGAELPPAEALPSGAEVVVTIEADAELTTDEAVDAASRDLAPVVSVVEVDEDAAAPATADLTADVGGVHELVILPVYWTAADAATSTGLKQTGDGVAAYWERQSGGALDVVVPAVAGWKQITAPVGCDDETIMTRALAAHGAAPATATRHVAVYFPHFSSCSFAGRATIGGGDMWINGNTSVYVMAHELGHNLGLGHANTLTCTSGGARVPLAASGCTAREYGDNADVMGQGRDMNQPGNISSAFAHQLGWAHVHDLSAAPTAATTYEIAPLASTWAVRGVRTPSVLGHVYVDYRPAVGPDARHEPGWAGVQAHLAVWNSTYRYTTTYLLDLQPAQSAFYRPQLAVGAPWSVQGGNATLTAVSTGTTAKLRVEPGAQSQQVQRYVTRVYTDLFGRSPDPTGLAGWTNALLAGTPRIAVANSITYSDEYRSRLIAESYMTYLGRGPDPAGASGWLGAMRAGTTIQQMEAGFIASDEYYARGGGTDAGWVRKLYDHVLGRSASTAEVNAWTAALAQGGSRRQVAMGFLLSTEHLTTVVDGYYQALLGRGIDPAGAQAWVVAIQGGARVEAIIGGIIASDEYYSKA